MVTWLEANDPAMEAWATQDLNGLTWTFDKEPDQHGNVEAPAAEDCEQATLAPLCGYG